MIQPIHIIDLLQLTNAQFELFKERAKQLEKIAGREIPKERSIGYPGGFIIEDAYESLQFNYAELSDNFETLEKLNKDLLELNLELRNESANKDSRIGQLELEMKNILVEIARPCSYFDSCQAIRKIADRSLATH